MRSLTKILSYVSKEHWFCFPPGIFVLISIKMIFWAFHSVLTIPLKEASGPYPSLYSSWHPTAEFNDFLSEKFKWSLILLRSSNSQWPSSHIQLLQMFLFFPFFPFLLREWRTISANILGAHHIFKVILEENLTLPDRVVVQSSPVHYDTSSCHLRIQVWEKEVGRNERHLLL